MLNTPIPQTSGTGLVLDTDIFSDLQDEFYDVFEEDTTQSAQAPQLNCPIAPLIALYRESQDSREREIIFNKIYAKLARVRQWMARMYMGYSDQLGGSHGRNEVLAMVNESIWDAIQKYDESRGAKFVTFLYRIVSVAIPTRAQQMLGPVRTGYDRIERARRATKKHLRTNPELVWQDLSGVMDEFNLSKEDMINLISECRHGFKDVSIDQGHGPGDDSPMELPAGDMANPQHVLIKRQLDGLQSFCVAQVETLNEIERSLIKARFFDDYPYSFDESCKYYQVSHSKAHRIIEGGLKKIREISMKKFGLEYDDYCFNLLCD